MRHVAITALSCLAIIGCGPKFKVAKTATDFSSSADSTGEISPAGSEPVNNQPGSAPVVNPPATGGTTGGMTGGTGSTTPAATALVAEPKPAVAPTPMAVANPVPVTTISTNQGQTSDVLEQISAGGGFVKAGEGLKSTQPGAYLEYQVNVVAAGSYGLAVYYQATVPGAIVDLYVNGVLVGKDVLSKSPSDDWNRAPVVLARLNLGKNVVRLVSGLENIGFTINMLQLNFPNNPLVNFGITQALPAAAPLPLIMDGVIDFYRLGLDQNKNGSQSWGCVWSYCFIEFLVSTPVMASYNVTISYSQQSLTNHACAGYSVNGVEQAQVEMSSATGVGVTAPKTIKFPAGTSRFRISNTNYFNNVFCFGANYNSIVLTPAPP